MCRIVEHIVIEANGAHRTTEEPYYCDKAPPVRPRRFCNNVERRTTNYYAHQPLIHNDAPSRVPLRPPRPRSTTGAPSTGGSRPIRGGGTFRPIWDQEDGVDRCPRCNWDLEDGTCHQCGISFNLDGKLTFLDDAVHDDDSGGGDDPGSNPYRSTHSAMDGHDTNDKVASKYTEFDFTTQDPGPRFPTQLLQSKGKSDSHGPGVEIKDPKKKGERVEPGSDDVEDELELFIERELALWASDLTTSTHAAAGNTRSDQPVPVAPRHGISANANRSVSKIITVP